MAEKQKRRNPSDFFIIDTRTSVTESTDMKTGKRINKGRDYTENDLSKNEEYAELLGQQKIGKLKEFTADTHIEPRVRSQATNHHHVSMITENTILCKTDADGLIWYPKNQKANAQRTLANLQRIDKEVMLHPMGLQFDEDLNDDESEGKLPVASRLK